MKILYLIIPGLVAIAGNIIFYILVKGRIDKSIEKHKISYSGVFKEKIEVNRQLLKKVFELKQKIQQYQYSGQKELGSEIFMEFNSFINFYNMNQPFLNVTMLDGLRKLTKELQGCFDDFYTYNSLSDKKIDPEIRRDQLKNYFESGNKFKNDHPFKEIEEILITEMKKELNIDWK